MLDKIKLLLNITGTSSDNLLELLLDIATDKAKILLYPFVNDISFVDLGSKYNYWIIQAVQQMYNSLGNETIKSYSENGLSISYAELQSGISVNLLNELIPYVKVLG